MPVIHAQKKSGNWDKNHTVVTNIQNLYFVEQKNTQTTNDKTTKTTDSGYMSTNISFIGQLDDSIKYLIVHKDQQPINIKYFDDQKRELFLFGDKNTKEYFDIIVETVSQQFSEKSDLITTIQLKIFPLGLENSV